MSDFRLQYRDEFQRYGREKGQIEKAKANLTSETAKLYNRLMHDPEVKAAIRTRNRDRRPKVVLGPVASPEEYRAIILQDDQALLREKGVVYNPVRKRFSLDIEEEVVKLALAAQRAFDQLKGIDAEKQAKSSNLDKLVAKRKKTTLAQAKASESQKKRFQAELDVLDRQIKQVQLQNLAHDPQSEVSLKRRAFLAALSELRTAVEGATTSRQAVVGDKDVRDALIELIGKAAVRSGVGETRIAEPLDYRHALTTLERFEKMVQVERLPSIAGRDQKSMFTVKLNGSESISIAIMPGVRSTQLPAKVAGEIGLSPPADAKVVEVQTGNGSTVKALQGELQSIQLGSFVRERVACLVIPADASDASTPILGEDLLELFSYEISADNELVLTQVTFPPAK